MKQLELDLEKIALTGKKKEKENFDFRIFLKGQDDDDIDRIVHKINEEITSQIDCQKCGNCCKSLRPCVTDAEIDKLSKIEDLRLQDFKTRFVEIDQADGMEFLKDTPCKYLKNKSCSIYMNRPEVCKSYPYTHKPGFISRTLGMIDNYEICPIVFNLFEQLKEALGYTYSPKDSFNQF